MYTDFLLSLHIANVFQFVQNWPQFPTTTFLEKAFKMF